MDDTSIRVNIHNRIDGPEEADGPHDFPSFLGAFFGENPGAVIVVPASARWSPGRSDRIISRDLNSILEEIFRNSLEHDKEMVKDDSVQILYEAVEAKEKGDCTICADEYPARAEVASLICGHVFHRECLTEWGKYKPACPNCKREIDYRLRGK